MSSSYRLVVITRRSAEWLGGALALSGGYVLTSLPGDLPCCAALERVVGEGYLASLPVGREMTLDGYTRPVDCMALVRAIRAEADGCNQYARCHGWDADLRTLADMIAS